jgi:small-conductance mechanosensitive channel
MPNQQLTSKEYFKVLSIIHAALFTGVLCFAGLAIFITQVSPMILSGELFRRMLQIIIPLFAIVSIVTGAGLFKKKIQPMRELGSLSDKLIAYRGLLIMFYALLEAPALLAITGYLLTGNYLFLAVVAFVFFLFVLHKPSSGKVIDDLRLDSIEQSQVTDPYANVVVMDSSE